MTALTISINESDPKRIAAALQQVTEGRTNATGTFTISANANSTLVTAPNCSVSSFVFLSATTMHAAWHMATTKTLPANGSFVVTHASNTLTDSIFGFVCLG